MFCYHKQMDTRPNIIAAIGTSAGGFQALSSLLSGLDKNMDASFLVVIHLSRKGIGDYFIHRLKKITNLECKLAKHGEEILRSCIYVAPPDKHLLVNEGKILLGDGPRENRWRPSINNLFRSVAAGYGRNSLGIILTGLLDDGTAGMSAIKRSGGTSIVQDPEEAEYPDMPLSVLNAVEVDHCVPIKEMPAIIQKKSKENLEQKNAIPEDVLLEARLDRTVSVSMDAMSAYKKSIYNCPDCGGGLYITQEDKPTHYRCHVGHSFTDNELLIRQSEAMESTLWAALRMMEERRNLLMRMHNKDKDKGLQTLAQSHLDKAEELQEHIANLRQILIKSNRA